MNIVFHWGFFLSGCVGVLLREEASSIRKFGLKISAKTSMNFECTIRVRVRLHVQFQEFFRGRLSILDFILFFLRGQIS